MQPLYGPTNPTPDRQAEQGVRRFASFVELLPEKEELYRQLHAEVWPEVVAVCARANMHNYTIWVQTIGDKKYIFRQFEYTGSDPEKDFAEAASEPVIRDKWWPITDGCMVPVLGAAEGELWREAELVMHLA